MAARSRNRTSATGGTKTSGQRRSAAVGSRAPQPRRSSAKSKSAAPRAKKAAAGWRLPGNALVWTVCLGVVLAAWWVYPVLKMHYTEQRQLASLTAQYKAVTSRNATLRKEVEQLKTPQGIESAARETLGLVHQGENAYVVMQQGAKKKSAPSAASLASVAPTAPSDPLTALFDALFGVRAGGR